MTCLGSSVSAYLLLLLTLPSCTSSCTPSERKSLLAFVFNLSSTSLPKGTAFPSWDSGRDPNCCRWDGITCDALGSVTRLLLPLRGLTGTISAAALLDLPSLTHVNLSRNSLLGGLEPKLLWSASLVELDVSFNRLDGQVVLTDPKLPREAGRQQPVRLQTLDLSSNFFSGSLPTSHWWASAPYLVALNASNNAFSGHIPFSICAVRAQLQALDLSYNNLGGGIPQGFGNCSQLRVLRFGNNNLQGQIPPGLYNAVSLHELSAPSVNIYGYLDAQGTIANVANLSLLDFSFNMLEGPVPESIGKLTNLKVLMLNNNQFNGSLPSTLSNCTKLTFLNLRFNRLAGQLSDVDFSNLSELQTLDLGFNNFTVANSELQGSIPAWLSLMRNLAAVDLKGNHLRGSIPGWLGYLSHLFYLDLSNNSLSGAFPVNLTALRTLTSEQALLEVHRSLLELPVFYDKGRQYNQWYNVRPSLNLQQNNLTGVIPPEIGRLKMLHVLNLGHNSFSGNIPPEIADLDNLEKLDLSSNGLVGEIPGELSKLHFLSKFNVAHNELSGEIPQGGQFSTFNLSSFDGNSGLCAQDMAPLQSCSETDLSAGKQYTRKHIDNKEFFRGFAFGVCSGEAFVIVPLVLIVPCRRRT